MMNQKNSLLKSDGPNLEFNPEYQPDSSWTPLCLVQRLAAPVEPQCPGSLRTDCVRQLNEPLAVSTQIATEAQLEVRYFRRKPYIVRRIYELRESQRYDLLN